jgi:hypothetical protein
MDATQIPMDTLAIRTLGTALISEGLPKTEPTKPTKPTEPNSMDLVVAVPDKHIATGSKPIPRETLVVCPLDAALISEVLPGTEPTKPTKADSVGFVGATSPESPEMRPEPDAAELNRASAVLNRAGVRIMQLDGTTTIGIWSDHDGPEVRRALGTFGSGQLPIRYLDGAGIPIRYKLRQVEGEPVPMNVLAEMERNPAKPWKVRDQMLHAMGWCSKPIPWAEGQAARLNRLSQEQGGRRGRITAETVRHGERMRGLLRKESTAAPISASALDTPVGHGSGDPGCPKN